MGFLEAVFVVVVRRHPVAALDHFPRRFRVERLVGIANGGTPETREERRQADRGEQEAVPEHADGFVH